jgi:hypothetical protein
VKITTPSQLILGTNITVDTTARTIALYAGGALVPADGVTWPALHSKLLELWQSGAPWSAHPFPTSWSESYGFSIGTDGHTFNNWTFAAAPTRSTLRGHGWTEFGPTGDTVAVYQNLRTVGTVPEDTTWYTHAPDSTTVVPLPYPGHVDIGMQAAAAGVFLRSRDVARTGFDAHVLGTDLPAVVYALIANDARVEDPDATVETAARYAGIRLRRYSSQQWRDTDQGPRPFNIVIDAAGQSLAHVYTWMRWAMRQADDLSDAPGNVAWYGRTSEALCDPWLAAMLALRRGVFIDNLRSEDRTRVAMIDALGAPCAFPWAPGAPDAAAMHATLLEVAAIHGLDPTAPLQVSQTSRTAGDIVQTIADSGGTVTVTRQP